MINAVAVEAARRARELVGQLDWERKVEDLDRVQAGIKHELETVLRELLQDGLADVPGALVAGGLTFPQEMHDSYWANGGGMGLVGLVRNDHPETAQEAAKAIKLRSGTQRAAVLLELFEANVSGLDGMTDETLQRTLRMGASSERPRRVELVRMGFVQDSGKREPTTSGQEAILWTITDGGIIAARKLEVQDPLPFD